MFYRHPCWTLHTLSKTVCLYLPFYINGIKTSQLKFQLENKVLKLGSHEDTRLLIFYVAFKNDPLVFNHHFLIIYYIHPLLFNLPLAPPPPVSTPAPPELVPLKPLFQGHNKAPTLSTDLAHFHPPEHIPLSLKKPSLKPFTPPMTNDSTILAFFFCSQRLLISFQVAFGSLRYTAFWHLSYYFL